MAGYPCWAHHGCAKEKEALGLCKLTEKRMSAVNGSVVTPGCRGRWSGCFLKAGFGSVVFFTVIASRMLSLLSLLHGLLLENARVVSAIPAATLTAQLPGRNRKLLHVHDISSKTTCLMQETAFPRAGHSPWGRIAVLVDRVMFLPQCHRHSNSRVVTEQAGSSCPFPAGCWYKPAGFHSSGPMLFHRSTRHTGSQAGVRLCSQATSDRMGGHSLKWH